MNRTKIKQTIIEAHRVIEAAEAVLGEMNEDVQRYLTGEGAGIKFDAHQYEAVIAGTRKTGALLRASMDLTRTLADLRRPS